MDDSIFARACASIGVTPAQVLRAEWIDNGPGWIGLVLDSVDTVRSLTPNYEAMAGLAVGVLGIDATGSTDVEVRAFAPSIGEDPVTGSLNAAFAVWLTREGYLPANYTVRQGTALGRQGEVSITTDSQGIWVGGRSQTVVSGVISL
ncbi:PhzF family phenazine biosynthesis protein [Leucobacter massiliensis]|uniref:PhzF family phenazine biosynthesis protein n=1 Tax=Leucobacter massiliensis TaxID=1686285 RepID=UPI0015E40F7D|nr:PhzF family phenazine biosynthesis protein [Leucobacter massiliensis]